MLTCKKCGSTKLAVMFDAIISGPIGIFHNFSKAAMRSRDVRLWGCDWHKADIICTDCGHVHGLQGDLPKVGSLICQSDCRYILNAVTERPCAVCVRSKTDMYEQNIERRALTDEDKTD